MKRLLTLLFIISILATSSCHSTSPSEARGDFLSSNVSQDSTANLQSVPAPDGFVNDFANVLDQQTEDQLETTLSEFKNRAKIDFVVVTVNTTSGQPIFDYSLAVARGWGVGARNPDKAGVLMLTAIDDRKWHVQISRALEKVLSNEEVGKLGGLLNAPFREKRYGEGVIQCVDAFIKTLSERRGST